MTSFGAILPVAGTSPVAGSAVGRGDLLRVWATRGESAVEGLAERLGYVVPVDEEQPRRPEGQVKGPAAGKRVVSTRAPDTGPLELDPVPFWRPEEVEEVATGEPVEEPVAPYRAEDLAPDPRARAPREPITPWPTLWRALDDALRAPFRSRQVDTRELVRRWARLEAVEPLPRRTTHLLTARATVVLDGARHLLPFWGDQDAVVAAVRRRLGKPAVRVTAVKPGAMRLRTSPSETVLALTDLGFLAGPEARAAWRRLGRRLERDEVRLRSLVLCPSPRWRGETAAICGGVDWSAPRRQSHRRVAPEKVATQDTVLVDRLLTLASPAVRVEPALLRALRRLIPEADLAVEAAAWRHEDVRGATSLALELKPSALRKRRRQFRALPEAERHRVGDLVRRFHRASPVELQVEERIDLVATGAVPEDDPEEEARLVRGMLRLAETVTSADSELREGAGDYLLRLSERASTGVVQHTKLRRRLAEAWTTAAAGRLGLEIPADLASTVLAVRAGDQVRQKWELRQRGGRLLLRPPAAFGDEVTSSLWTGFETAGSVLAVTVEGEATSRSYAIGPGGCEVLLPAGKSLMIHGGAQAVSFRRYEKPEWAAAVGRDRFGLWADLEVGGVRHRLRWIPPGSFWMGSPEDEVGRGDDEGPRHRVTLTTGFWLGETPVTQDVWQAVEGGNPSQFQSPRRPVEQVSWHECKSFIEQLNKGESSSAFRLPTEAEWEYACRAGTETATYAGELEILGERNAPLLDDIAWYGGNSGVDFELETGTRSSDWPAKQHSHEQAGTREVAKKKPNPWGLYDMLGNVYEWCEDGWDVLSGYEIGGSPQQNPVRHEGSNRVIRGGSGFSFARHVRAAFRGGSGPGYRSDRVGFRLARGQGGPGQNRTVEVGRGPREEHGEGRAGDPAPRGRPVGDKKRLR